MVDNGYYDSMEIIEVMTVCFTSLLSVEASQPEISVQLSRLLDESTGFTIHAEVVIMGRPWLCRCTIVVPRSSLARTTRILGRGLWADSCGHSLLQC